MSIRMFTSSCFRRLSIVKSHLDTNIIKQPTASFATKPIINVSKPSALVDEEICISVDGLQKGQEITLQTYIKDGTRSFGSCGHYIANEEGKVNTFEDECHGGTYDGVEPMGLFWSIRSPPGNKPRRILKSDVTTPFDIKIAVHPGFRGLAELPWTENFPSLASCNFRQCFMTPGVTCIPIKEDGIVGSLFLPPGEGPFPAVIDVFGMTNQFPGHRSSLLASQGFASFVIAYVGHEGLATSGKDLNYSYFLKAYDWLSRHPKVNQDAMGGLGSCIGGAYLSIIAWKRPSMKCFVGLNCVAYPSGPTQEVEGEVVEESPWNLDGVVEIDGAISFRPLSNPENNLQSLPYWRHGAKILQIQGTDDQCLNPDSLKNSHKEMPKELQGNLEFISYPGAGHIIEPPFMPLCRTNFNAIFNLFLLWGGQPKQHAHAQMDSWPRIVAFFKQHLTQQTSQDQSRSFQEKDYQHTTNATHSRTV